MKTEEVILGAGCFWCVEAVFCNLRGVIEVISGYSGGISEYPTYNEVCSGTSGHTEVCKISFDSDTIPLENLLTVFFMTHDPTTLNRQGNDVGPQYRSVIYFHSPEQKNIAEKIKAQVQNEFDDAIVTAIEPACPFYPAEDYHQNYFYDNGYQPYCMFVISPKVKKFRDKFKHLLKN